MRRSWKTWILSHLIIISVILVLFGAMAGYTYYVNQQSFIINVDENSDYSITMERSKQ